MEYEPVILNQYFGDLQARRPKEYPWIMVLRLTHPGWKVVENADGEPKAQGITGEETLNRDLTLENINDLLDHLKEQGYRGLIGDYMGEDYHFSQAQSHCQSLKAKSWVYWFVNMPFWNEKYRLPNLKYEEPEQKERNASSVDEAVEKVLELMKS